MTTTDTTPRPDAAPAMLSESRIRQIELAAKDFEHARVREAYPGAPVAYLRQLIASHRAQAATIAALRQEMSSVATSTVTGRTIDDEYYIHGWCWDRAVERLLTAAQPAPGSEDGGGE